jgi:phosphatidylserine/phosphatidylglycerophosphate/cardiolipin synthase-like enzyme
MVWVPESFFQPTLEEARAMPRFFEPKEINRRIRVQPLLTPDNYADKVYQFINSAQQSIYFQNQSFKMAAPGENPPHYEKLLKALLQKQKDGLDVRIILRRIGKLHDTISRIKNYGFDMDRVRLQTNCHTKGIVIDGTAVMLGSQNWTGDGTGPNRDASVIFYDKEIAEYFQQTFFYDWGRIGKPRIDESLPMPEMASGEESTPRARMILMPLSRWLGES